MKNNSNNDSNKHFISDKCGIHFAQDGRPFAWDTYQKYSDGSVMYKGSGTKEEQEYCKEYNEKLLSQSSKSKPQPWGCNFNAYMVIKWYSRFRVSFFVEV